MPSAEFDALIADGLYLDDNIIASGALSLLTGTTRRSRKNHEDEYERERGTRADRCGAGPASDAVLSNLRRLGIDDRRHRGAQRRSGAAPPGDRRRAARRRRGADLRHDLLGHGQGGNADESDEPPEPGPDAQHRGGHQLWRGVPL